MTTVQTDLTDLSQDEWRLLWTNKTIHIVVGEKKNVHSKIEFIFYSKS